MYYAAINIRGFANTWEVAAFRNKADREAWLYVHCTCAKAITRKEIGKYIQRPKPFDGTCWAVDADTWVPREGHFDELILGLVEQLYSLDVQHKYRVYR